MIQPTAPAAPTAAVTRPMASAMRALRWMKSKIPPNMAHSPPDAFTTPQAGPFIKVYEGLIAIW